MQITPKEFVHLLKNSTLSPIEQQAILDFLSHLSSENIQRLAQVLKHDVDAQERLRADVEGKRDALLLQFNLEAKKMEMLGQEKPTFVQAALLEDETETPVVASPSDFPVRRDFLRDEEVLFEKKKRDSFFPLASLPSLGADRPSAL